ncbi:MAG TPA: DciA family protein [Gammaproteobacteria bacterium]|nr:DciA family protein [Gammaproteobacteria bacterium]
MTISELRALGDLLSGGELAGLVAGARERSALTRAVRDLLPAAEAHEVVAAHWDQETLVISVSSGAWAARLRYRQSALGAERVRVRVAPPRQPTQKSVTGKSTI